MHLIIDIPMSYLDKNDQVRKLAAFELSCKISQKKHFLTDDF